ncbi:hypothetical protein [Flavobacterium sp.]|uniref:hypothetical protein n=1 Tax=Flavobacterium sp. TaxID=239 RepID=UPI00122B36EB|nr:hypothetical protein [Flavobacterium sp.]RZJ73963.1 MAG: hypothetical protein EOO49_00995 [Flavobacterium sp.]
MKNIGKHIVTALFCLIGTISIAQLKMDATGSYENKEFRNLLEFEEIDYYKVAISGENVKGRNYSIVSKEIWKGKVKKVDTIFNSREHEVFKIDNDSLLFTVMSGKTDAKNLRIKFNFGRFGISRNYKSTKSDEYSLRDFGTRMPISVGKPFYAFAYILPTEHKDGSKSWCEVEADGTDIENWGKKFNIEHYLLFEMKFD